MKKILLLLLLFTGLLNGQIVNIPDANFKAQLLYASENYQIASTQTPNNQGEGITEYMSIDTNGDGEIQISEALAIKSLTIYTSPFSNPIMDITGIEYFQELIGFKCRSTQINNMPINNLTNLIYLECSHNQLLTNLDLSMQINLQTLNCMGNSFSNLNLSFLNNLINLDCSYNPLMTLDLSNLNNLVRLNCSYNQLTSLNLLGLLNIQYLDCSINQISNLNLTDQINLKNLGCGYNLLSSLNLTNQLNLQNLGCSDNLITNLDVSNLTNLVRLYCQRNQISMLNVDNLTNLILLDCSFNLLTNLSFNNVPTLQTLNCTNNLINSINVTNLINLMNLDCGNNNLTSLNLNNNINLDYVQFLVNPLQIVFIKNGRSQYYQIGFPLRTNNLSLDISTTPVRFICVDDSDEADYWLSIFQNTIVCNNYCSFTPGGNYNTISGNIKFDANNNGCDVNDLPQSNIRLNINDGTNTGASFSNNLGNYSFFTQSGSFDVSSDIENPTWFNFSPTTATIPFADNNNNIATQDFCITANGVHNDLEIVIAPIAFARPGFDAKYNIVFKNKGNQTLSGDLSLTYDDAVLDYVSATLAPNSQSTGAINWNYTNLLPFESRSIEITYNVNSPVEIPSVNIGDILNFTTSITPIAADDLPLDNTFTYYQTVVGSFDPNDIICLEGTSVSPSTIGDYLHYVINFENTGNFPAENVVVKTTIDPTKYDINSLQLLTTSAPVDARITGNDVEFIFKNLQLAGPGGHGHVLLKIKSKNTLVSGNIVSKRADIFFDYNAPVDTGLANTVFQSLSNSVFKTNTTVTVSPNPATSRVNINSDSQVKSIELYDVQGRILETILNNNAIDVSNKTNGIYFLKITTEKGAKVEKLVKE